jgi:hypothetical protein
MKHCEECFQKQLKIEQQQEEIVQLKAKLKYRERKESEGFFGSSTPSAKIPVKANTPDKENKPRGAKPGHKGSGRRSVECENADRIERVQSSEGERCPYCNDPLTEQDDHRTVIDSRPLKAEKIVYVLPKKTLQTLQEDLSAVSPWGAS